MAHAFQAVHPDGIAREQILIFVNLLRHHLDEALDLREQVEGRLKSQPANAAVRGHHALAGDMLEDTQNFFALAEGVEEDGHRAEIDCVGP